MLRAISHVGACPNIYGIATCIMAMIPTIQVLHAKATVVDHVWNATIYAIECRFVRL